MQLCDVCTPGTRRAWSLHGRELWKSKTARTGTASTGTAISGERITSSHRPAKSGGFEVSLAGRRRPSAVEIEEDLARRQKRLRTEKAGMQWLTRIGQALNGFCVDCVVDFSQRADLVMKGPLYAPWARKCNKTCCRRNKRCLRCVHRGHNANQCDVIASVQSGTRRCCRRCFLIPIGGESTLDGEQFGREGACSLEICTKLLMLCWSNAKIPREVLLHERSPVVIEGSCVRTAKSLRNG